MTRLSHSPSRSLRPLRATACLQFVQRPGVVLNCLAIASDSAPTAAEGGGCFHSLARPAEFGSALGKPRQAGRRWRRDFPGVAYLAGALWKHSCHRCTLCNVGNARGISRVMGRCVGLPSSGLPCLPGRGAREGVPCPAVPAQAAWSVPVPSRLGR